MTTLGGEEQRTEGQGEAPTTETRHFHSAEVSMLVVEEEKHEL
jgi:hypothetical protein